MNYACQLCYLHNNFKPTDNIGAFLKHMADAHKSPKAINMLETLEIMGTDKEEYILRHRNKGVKQ